MKGKYRPFATQAGSFSGIHCNIPFCFLVLIINYRKYSRRRRQCFRPMGDCVIDDPAACHRRPDRPSHRQVSFFWGDYCNNLRRRAGAPHVLEHESYVVGFSVSRKFLITSILAKRPSGKTEKVLCLKCRYTATYCSRPVMRLTPRVGAKACWERKKCTNKERRGPMSDDIRLPPFCGLWPWPS